MGRSIERAEFLPATNQVQLSWKDAYTDTTYSNATYDYAVVAAPFTKVRSWRFPNTRESFRPAGTVIANSSQYFILHCMMQSVLCHIPLSARSEIPTPLLMRLGLSVTGCTPVLHSVLGALCKSYHRRLLHDHRHSWHWKHMLSYLQNQFNRRRCHARLVHERRLRDSLCLLSRARARPIRIERNDRDSRRSGQRPVYGTIQSPLLGPGPS